MVAIAQLVRALDCGSGYSSSSLLSHTLRFCRKIVGEVQTVIDVNQPQNVFWKVDECWFVVSVC